MRPTSLSVFRFIEIDYSVLIAFFLIKIPTFGLVFLFPVGMPTLGVFLLSPIKTQLVYQSFFVQRVPKSTGWEMLLATLE